MSKVPNFSSKIPRELITRASELLNATFQVQLTIHAVDQITELDRRNQILRLTVDSTSDLVPRSILLKKTSIEPMGETEREQLSRFAHDWAGLEFLHAIGARQAPAFYGGDLEHRFILLEDLGLGHPSLVGPLTRQYSNLNLINAQRALKAYVASLGQMHADSFGKTDLFTSILQRIYPQSIRYHRLTDETHNENEKSFENFKAFIQLDQSKELLEEMQQILEISQSSNHFKVLLHGDICPDNVYIKNDKLFLIDFEYGDIGHAFIDGVYPRMSMPSCWCSRTIPKELIEQLEQIYRNELKKKIQTADDEKSYQYALTFGCALDGLDHCPSFQPTAYLERPFKTGMELPEWAHRR